RLLARAARVAAGEDRHRLRRLSAVPSVRPDRGHAAARCERREEPGGMTVVPIEGGVTTAAGFRAAGVAAGIKASGALDLTLIVADAPAAAAALFTTNQVKAAPVQVSREQLARSGGLVRAVVVNSGCANACTGVRGLETARATVDAAATLIGCPAEQVLVASTGVIGVHLDRDTVLAGLRAAVSALGPHDEAAARGIMTTDLEPKRAAV